MLQMKDLDDDGFELWFDDDITKEEKEFYVRAYPNVNMIADRRIHCTSCDGHIGTAPASEEIIRRHPILRVMHCNQCDQLYNTGEFEKGEDGSELFCRWCGQGGAVLCCSSCTYVFCKNCILRNFSHSTLLHIKHNQHWNCFACEPESILPLQAQYWALKNFFAKQKEMIRRQAIAGRCYVEITNAMNHDSSTCCPNLHQLNDIDESEGIEMSGSDSESTKEEVVRPRGRVRATQKRRKLTRNRKRRRVRGGEYSSDDALRVKGSSRSHDDSDSIEMISDSCALRAQESTTEASQIRIENVRSENAAHREAGQSLAAATYTHTFLVSVTTTSDDPIYHAINDYRIELNAASQQSSIRLSDGKIVHVRKLSTISNATGAQNVPSILQSVPIQHDFGQQATQFQSVPSANSSQAFQPIAYTLGCKEAPAAPRKYPNGPVGDACTQFEQQIFNGMEMCQNTDNKLKTLMSSNAYKTVRSVNDVKELLIHMSYLMTITLGRFKTLQDKCIDDLRQLGFPNEADSLAKGNVIKKYGSESDVNEVEIVEPKHATIDLDDSDDEPSKMAFDKSAAVPSAGDVQAAASVSSTLTDDKKRIIPQPPEKVEDRVTSSKSVFEDNRHKSNVVVIVLPQEILNVASSATAEPPNIPTDPETGSHKAVKEEKADERVSPS